MESKRFVRVRIFGKVQGVFFRTHTQEKAIALNLKGYVMNMPDGSVFLEAAGVPTNIEEFVSWCYIGPPKATVIEVELEEIEPVFLPNRFEIRR